MSTSFKYLTPGIIAASAAVTVAYAWYCYRNRDRIPAKWKLIGYVDKIAIYPIKSGNYRELEAAECTELGLKEIQDGEQSGKHIFRDREFLIYNVKEKEVLRLIKTKKAVLISAFSTDENTVTFQAPNVPDYELNLPSVIENAKRVEIGRYGFPIETIDCGDEAARWVSNYLTSGKNEDEFRMGFYVENVTKRTNVVELMSSQSKKFLSVYKHMRQSDGGLYAWITSYLVTNKSSFDEINDCLAEEDKANIYNFRPNIIVKGCDPFVEDEWKWIKFGNDVVMRYFKPCTRCTVTTINPDTGEINKNLEPFRMLKKCRKVKDVKGYDLQGDLPVFGANMGLYVPGRLKVGDPVYEGV
ncbi:mitochondrial amidoxime-reducing component 1 [Planococcus citri]|uniref:mitochondrial amidoxime-reducing component 1 n=1 Tax=Planococcus citri TaxID=170843 RepID=UPI0031F9E022